jgi:hypothetical protein
MIVCLLAVNRVAISLSRACQVYAWCACSWLPSCSLPRSPRRPSVRPALRRMPATARATTSHVSGRCPAQTPTAVCSSRANPLGCTTAMHTSKRQRCRRRPAMAAKETSRWRWHGRSTPRGTQTRHRSLRCSSPKTIRSCMDTLHAHRCPPMTRTTSSRCRCQTDRCCGRRNCRPRRHSNASFC